MAGDTVRYESDWADDPVERGRRNVALVGHDNVQSELAEWAAHNRDVLAGHVAYATGSTGRILESQLDIPVRRFLSGPLGGDQQIGASPLFSDDYRRVVPPLLRTAADPTRCIP